MNAPVAADSMRIWRSLEKMNRSLRQGVKAPPDFYRKIAGGSMSGGDLARVLVLRGLASVMLFVTSGASGSDRQSAEVAGGGEEPGRGVAAVGEIPGIGSGTAPSGKTFIVGSRKTSRCHPPISNSARKTLPEHRFWCGCPAPSRCVPAACITGSTGNGSATRSLRGRPISAAQA